MTTTFWRSAAITISALSIFFIAGCGDKATQTGQTQVIGGVNFVANAEGFTAVDALTRQENHFLVIATLEKDATVSAFANSNAQLQNGVKIQFTQTATTIEVSINGNKEIDFAHLPGTEVSLHVDVHNGEGGKAHVLVWDRADAKKGNHFFEKDDAPQGMGNKWGIAFNKAQVKSVTVSEAYGD